MRGFNMNLLCNNMVHIACSFHRLPSVRRYEDTERINPTEHLQTQSFVFKEIKIFLRMQKNIKYAC